MCNKVEPASDLQQHEMAFVLKAITLLFNKPERDQIIFADIYFVSGIYVYYVYIM